MQFKLQCMSCGERLEIVEASQPYTKDGETIVDVAVDPCACKIKEPVEDDSPIRLPYLTLARILNKQVVTVTYRKVNGDIRELTGFLGTNDLRHVDSKLHYFHELNDNGVDSDIGNNLMTSCKVLMVDRIINVTHYDAGSNGAVQTMYEVEEYF